MVEINRTGGSRRLMITVKKTRREEFHRLSLVNNCEEHSSLKTRAFCREIWGREMLNAIEFFVEEFKFYKNMKLNKHLESGYKSFCNDKSIFT